MKTLLTALAILITGSNIVAQDRPVFVPGQAVVRFKASTYTGLTKRVDERGIVVTSNEGVDSLFSLLGVTRMDRLHPYDEFTELGITTGMNRSFVIYFRPELKVEETCRIIESAGYFDSAVPNIIFYSCSTPDDPLYPQQWALPKLGMSDAWSIQKGSESIPIAVLDAGFQLDHPDLEQKFLQGNDVADVVVETYTNQGYYTVSNEDYTTYDDFPWGEGPHGTEVAGIAAASTNNYLGIAGVGWDTKIIPVRCGVSFRTPSVPQFPYQGIYESDDIVAALDWVRTNTSARVINMSFGQNNPLAIVALHEALDAALNSGIVLVAAMGNGGINTVNYYPASYGGVIAVGATNSSDVRYTDSNYGNTLSVVAPGYGVLTTTFTSSGGSDYQTRHGTSYATPHVAGAAALLLSNQPNLTPAMVKSAIEQSATDVPAMGGQPFHIEYGHGRLQVHSLVKKTWSQFVNVLTGTEWYSSLSVNAGSGTHSIPSGSVLGVEPPTGFMLCRTNALPFVINWSGTTQKHLRWYGTAPFAFVLTLGTDPLDGSRPKKDAWFSRTDPVTITAELIEGGEGGSIEFRDPWRYYSDESGNWFQSDTPLPYDAPFEIQNNELSSYGGVFLNQGSPNWVPPFYSVGALSPPPGLTSHFVKWSGSSATFQDSFAVETPVVFTASSAVATAKYKAERASTNLMATALNGQRKVVLADVWEANNVSYAVYESGGHIWYIRNDGSGWSPERLTDQATTTCRNPSIAATWFATGTIFVHIAWEEQDAVNPNQWNVKYSHSENGGTSWWAPVTLGQGYEPVCGGDFVSMVVWRNSSGLRFRVEPSRSSLEGQVPGTDASAREFSLAGTGNTFWLAFIQGPTNGGGIRVKRMDAWWSSVILSYPIENPAAQYSWITDCRHANVTATGKTLVSWDAIADGVIGPPPPDPTGPMAAGAANRRVVLAERITTGWAYVSIFSYGNYDNISPSIGLDARPGISKANLLWQWGTNGIAHSSRAIGGYNWSTIVNLEYASAPTLTPYVSRAASIPWRVWTGLSGPPYSIVFTGSEGDGSGSDSPEVKDNPIVSGDSQLGQRVSRQATIRLDSLRFGQSEPGGVTGELIVHCEPFSVVSNGVRTQLDFYSDSTGFQDWLGSVAAVIPRDGDSLSGALAIGLRNFQIRNPSISLNTPISKLTVKVGSATLQGRTILLSDLAGLGVADTVVWFQATITAHNLRGKTVALRNRLVGQDVNRDPGWSEMITVDSLGGAFPMEPTRTTVEQGANQIPTVFALHSNYPNPFNPSTQINYDLPEPATVSLVVYDVLGRKVVGLAEGYHAAGYHSATWDASGQASGVYFARFVVTSSSGEVKYSKVNKLVLMK